MNNPNIARITEDSTHPPCTNDWYVSSFRAIICGVEELIISNKTVNAAVSDKKAFENQFFVNFP